MPPNGITGTVVCNMPNYYLKERGSNMFRVNEYVVYGQTGVCLVEGIEQIEGQDYYCLRSLYQDCSIKTPVNGKIPLRKVISGEQANALIDMIPSIKAVPINSSNTRDLSEKYRGLVSSQDCHDLIELTMSIHAKDKEVRKAKKKLNGTDETYWKRAEGMLFGELAIALGIPFDEVKSYIRNRVEKGTGVVRKEQTDRLT